MRLVVSLVVWPPPHITLIRTAGVPSAQNKFSCSSESCAVSGTSV